MEQGNGGFIVERNAQNFLKARCARVWGHDSSTLCRHWTCTLCATPAARRTSAARWLRVRCPFFYMQERQQGCARASCPAEAAAAARRPSQANIYTYRDHASWLQDAVHRPSSAETLGEGDKGGIANFTLLFCKKSACGAQLVFPAINAALFGSITPRARMP